jgi:hypothetical protein
MKKVGHGVFGWPASERRSNRYGAIHLSDRPYEKPAVTKVEIDRPALYALNGLRVRTMCKVVETRTSGHVGDLFLGIYPSTPEVGEEVDLGAGLLTVRPSYDEWPDFVFLPKEPRPELWLDPRKLYRLHDFTPMAELPANNEESAISAGDGYLQFKEKEGKEVVSVLPKIEDLGEGMLLVTSPGAGKIGERFPVKRKE